MVQFKRENSVHACSPLFFGNLPLPAPQKSKGFAWKEGVVYRSSCLQVCEDMQEKQ